MKTTRKEKIILINNRIKKEGFASTLLYIIERLEEIEIELFEEKEDDNFKFKTTSSLQKGFNVYSDE